jgi:phytanoyl-CoA hydroxylase
MAINLVILDSDLQRYLSQVSINFQPYSSLLTELTMDSIRRSFRERGFVRINGFFSKSEVESVRADAKWVFAKQMVNGGFLSRIDADEREFENGMRRYFLEDSVGFINCGKTCQHLIGLHKLSLRENLVAQLIALGLTKPNICTRPVLFFNSRHLAKVEFYYKYPPHQDWRSMQGSLNSVVVWVPLANIPRELGALEVVPGSHLWGLQESREDSWYRHIEGLPDTQYDSVEMEAGDVLIFSAFVVHRSGDNITDSIRWSCHFRYNDLEEPTFVCRKYPNPYNYAPQQELVTKNFPSIEELRKVFAAGATEAAPAERAS